MYPLLVFKFYQFFINIFTILIHSYRSKGTIEYETVKIDNQSRNNGADMSIEMSELDDKAID